MPAVIRIRGNRKELEEFIPRSGLQFSEALAAVRRRRLNPDVDHLDTTYNLTISEADGDSVPLQINDVINYLRQSGQQIADLHRSVSDSLCIVDFSWNFPIQSVGQYNTFTIDLIALLYKYDIALEVSVYKFSRIRKTN